MGKRPNLDALDKLFEKGVDFRLPAKLYEECTGAPLPKEKNYLINTSAFAQRAKERGYFIANVEEKATIEKTVVVKKKVG